MRLNLIDRIIHLEPPVCLRATKSLTLSDEYLRDHFPLRPIMPGVMMLEAMYQSAAWLVRIGEDFAHSMVVLSEVKTIKFADLVAPGQTLVVAVDAQNQDPRYTWLKCQGELNGRVAVRGRLVLERYNLGDEDPTKQIIDRLIVKKLREQLRLLLV